MIRQLADAAGDVDAYRATYAPNSLYTPLVAAEGGRRLLGAARVEEAGETLRLARPSPTHDTSSRTSTSRAWR